MGSLPEVAKLRGLENSIVLGAHIWCRPHGAQTTLSRCVAVYGLIKVCGFSSSWLFQAPVGAVADDVLHLLVPVPAVARRRLADQPSAPTCTSPISDTNAGMFLLILEGPMSIWMTFFP